MLKKMPIRLLESNISHKIQNAIFSCFLLLSLLWQIGEDYSCGYYQKCILKKRNIILRKKISKRNKIKHIVHDFFLSFTTVFSGSKQSANKQCDKLEMEVMMEMLSNMQLKKTVYKNERLYFLSFSDFFSL